jgi:predicted nucleic acid-binding Zn finger protein
MQGAFSQENALIERACVELESRRALSPSLKEALQELLGDRFTNGWELAISRKVRRYEFAPSGRVVWAVQGRKSEYQVMPDIPFCYCDDYYFRVMDRKRGLCYHIIAQRIAVALNQFEAVAKKDSQYSIVTARWRAKEASEKSD